MSILPVFPLIIPYSATYDITADDFGNPENSPVLVFFQPAGNSMTVNLGTGLGHDLFESLQSVNRVVGFAFTVNWQIVGDYTVNTNNSNITLRNNDQFYINGESTLTISHGGQNQQKVYTNQQLWVLTQIEPTPQWTVFDIISRFSA